MVKPTDFVSGMKRQVGWFVLLGAGALLFVLVTMGMRSNLFAKKFDLFVEPPSASTFYEGQPVKFQGFAVGNIDDIQLQHEGQVRIRLRLLERYHHMLHQGAVVHFVKQGLLGEQIVEITAGDLTKEPLRNEQLLPYETEASLEQLLVDLKPAVSNANVFLSEMAKISVWMSDPYGSLQASFAGVQQMSSGLKGEALEGMVSELTRTLQELRRVVRSVNDKQVVNRLEGALSQSQKVLDEVHPLVKNMGEKTPEILQSMEAVLEQVNQLTAELTLASSDLSQLTPELPGVARETREALAEVKVTLKQLQESWLLGGGKVPAAVVDTVEVAPPVLDMQP